MSDAVKGVVGLATVGFAGAFLWSAVNVLAVPVLALTGMNTIYNWMSGTDEVVKAKAEARAVQMAKVSIGQPVFHYMNNWSFTADKVTVTVRNDSDADAFWFTMICTFKNLKDPPYYDETGKYHSQGRAITFENREAVVRAHQTSEVAFDVLISHTVPDPATLKCTRNFGVDMDAMGPRT